MTIPVVEPRATTPRFLWPVPDDTATVRQGAAAIRSLGNSIDGALVFGNEWISMSGPTATFTVASGAWRSMNFDFANLVGSSKVSALNNVDGAGVNLWAGQGLYLCYFSVSWVGAIGGRRIMGVGAGQNASPAAAYQSTLIAPTTAIAVVQTMTFGYVVTNAEIGGRICLNVYQDSGASVNISSARYTVLRAATVI